MPKKAQSAYFLFLNDNRAAVKESNPGLGLGPQQKLLAAKWKELDATEKQKYADLAVKDKERYEQENAAERQAMIDRGEDPDKPKAEDEFSEEKMAFPLGRVRKIVKLDPDVKNISKEGMLLISKATELFVAMMAVETNAKTDRHKRKTMKESDVYECVHDNELLDWLKPDFENMPIQEAKTVKKSKVVEKEAPANTQEITSFFSGNQS